MKKLTKKEIFEHFMFGVEVEEPSGYRYWIPCEGYESWQKTASNLPEGLELSDMDMLTHHSYPGMQEFYDGYFDWHFNNRTLKDTSVNAYYDTVYALA